MGYRNELEAIILGTLKSGPMHGYSISQTIKKNGEGLLKLGDNQIYPTLHRLELSGLVHAEWQHQEGKPARKVYALTADGGAKLEAYRKEWDRYVAAFSAMLGPREAFNA